ncbi:MAG TPA: hypothetical protein VK047_11415 [Zeimonas sp.]|nr:hypothetical protein [Zeimonas sp.]
MKALAVPLAAVAAVVTALLPLGAAAAPSDAPAAVFECSTRDGRTVYSDEPCVGAPRVRVWSPRASAPGIERSNPSAPAPAAPAALAAAAMGQDSRADTTDYGPWVDCQRRGGRFDVAARICHLPDDAARQMFGSAK